MSAFALSWLTPRLLLDALCWWAAMAGLVGVADCGAWYGRWRTGERWPAVPMPATYALALGLISLALLIGGVAIPLTSRIDNFDIASPIMVLLRIASWCLLASAEWIMVIARARQKAVMGWTAAFTFVAVLVAAALSAHA